uniref:Uncharacterized protein n=1 Tax=Rhizophora mucronata TaxID=61149 RepID=A0A2P2Q7F6_RHIMU
MLLHFIGLISFQFLTKAKQGWTICSQPWQYIVFSHSLNQKKSILAIPFCCRKSGNGSYRGFIGFDPI